nr:ORF5 [Bracoviriform inaniti]
MSASKPHQFNDEKATGTKTRAKPHSTDYNHQSQRKDYLDDIKGSIITIKEINQMIKEIVPHLEQTRKSMENQLETSKDRKNRHSDRF